MPDLFNLNLPTIGKKGTVEQRLEKLEAYLINLTEQLRFTLANLDPEDNFSTTALQVYTSTSKGEKGSPGKSAYQYAVEQGYEGTETEFAQALAGVSDIQADVEQLQTEQTTMKAEMEGAQKDIQDAEERIGSTEADIVNISNRLTVAEKNIAELMGGTEA